MNLHREARKRTKSPLAKEIDSFCEIYGVNSADVRTGKSCKAVQVCRALIRHLRDMGYEPPTISQVLNLKLRYVTGVLKKTRDRRVRTMNWGRM